MLRTNVILLLLIIPVCLLAYEPAKLTMIENFESGSVTLTSWQNEDIAPSAWLLDQSVTYNSSLYALKLTGNTWKQQAIVPVPVVSNTVFQVASRMSGNNGRIQGIGFSNGTNTLFYSFEGTATLNIDQWVTVYQGAFSVATWNLYQLPIGADWWAYFDQLPVITSIIYVNDLDTGSGSIWFDNICNIVDDLPVPPQVSITYTLGTVRTLSDGVRTVTVNFFSHVIDPDSGTFTYQWNFGDSTFSSLANPVHTYTVVDNHPYRVYLKVIDGSGKYGLASCLVNVDPGPGQLPITMNFVGDVMLARRYEQAGGIIPTQGVNTIFAPTRHLLGDAADVTVANLEVVLTNQGTPHPTKSVVYRGNPANISGLVYAGIDVVSTANNHALDYGLAGLQQMQQLLDQNNILHSGAGANSYEAYTPVFYNKHGLNIAFLRSSDRTGQYNNTQPYLNAGHNKSGFAYMTPYYIGQQLTAVQNIADLKIVEMHGGSEYSLAPGSNYDKNIEYDDFEQDGEYGYYTDVPHMWDLAIRRYAIDQGADMVIVHHPHIIQAMEIYNGKLIAHSIGNFVFDLDYPETYPSMILYVDANLNGFGNYRIVPIYIDDYIPVRAQGKLGIHILDYIAKRSRDLNTIVVVNKDDVTAKVITDTMTLVAYPVSTQEQRTLSDIGSGMFSTEPFILNRYGSISSIDYINPGNVWQYRLGQQCLWMNNMEDEGSTLWNLNFTTETYDNTIFHEGNRSIKITATTTTQTVPLDDRMRWYNNTNKYTLHGWIKTHNATSANIDIKMYQTRTSATATSTQSITTAISGTSDWTFYSKEITIPTNCYYYNIECKLGSGTAWFDEVGLIEWTNWFSHPQVSSVNFPNDYYWMQIKGTDNPKRVAFQYTEKDYFPLPGYQLLQPRKILISDLNLYPNPFKSDSHISFQLLSPADVCITIYNVKGQKVRQLLRSELVKGRHNLSWNGKDAKNKELTSGVYFLRIETTEHSETRKMLLLR